MTALWFALSVAAMMLLGEDSAGLAMLLGTGATLVVGYVTRDRGRVPDMDCAGIEISSSRIERILRRYRPAISLGGKTISPRKVVRALAQPEAMQQFQAFQTHYMHDLIDEVWDGKLDWNNENCKLFFELMRQRHRFYDGVIIASLIYVMEERIYQLYQETLGHLRGADLQGFIREIAFRDICCEAPFDATMVRRFARDCGLRVSARKLESLYWKARKSIEVSRFEQNLKSPPTRPGSIAEQIRSESQRSRIDSLVSEHLETEPDRYIIVGPDHSRDSRLDAYYRKHFSYVLSRAFDGHCCACGDGMTALQFDHFWHPKSAGGNFLMRSRSGTYVNNCIPLCGSCNASKGKRDFRDFFDEATVEDLVRRSQSINAFVNEHMASFCDPAFPERAVIDAPAIAAVDEPVAVVESA